MNEECSCAYENNRCNISFNSNRLILIDRLHFMNSLVGQSLNFRMNLFTEHQLIHVLGEENTSSILGCEKIPVENYFTNL